MSWQKVLFVTIHLALSGLFLVGCGTPTVTPIVVVVAPTPGTQPTTFPDVPIWVPPTNALVPPTDTLVPPANTLVPPTNTLVPPIDTETPIVPTPTNTPEAPKLVVILMDRRYSGFVDHNAMILSSLPVDIREEITNLEWDRTEEVIALNPDLIIIHISAFMSDSDFNFNASIPKMQQFICDTFTRTGDLSFLFYTSSNQPNEQLFLDETVRTFGSPCWEPSWYSRVYALANAGDSSWDQRLKDKVRGILKLN